jgi:putative phage-type endonuclease
MDVKSEYAISNSTSIDSLSSLNDTQFVSISEDDWIELTITIQELINEILEENIIRISNANIYKEITQAVLDVLYETISHLFPEDDILDDIQELAEQMVEIEFERSDIPKRSLTMTLDNLEEQTEEMKNELEFKIQLLRDIPQPQQKSREWYEFRYNLISASNLWKALGTEAQRNSLIYEKCKPLDIEKIEQLNSSIHGSMHWGVKYEPVTVEIYEDMYQTKVEEFGCIQHPKYSFIGASPDGINIDSASNRFGRMLEIKNIVNREITGIPKTEYWVQTQIQMETCNLELCDFVETKFNEYDKASFYNDSIHEYKGVILHFIERPEMENDIIIYKPSSPKYIYKPLSLENNELTISSWIETKKQELSKENYALFTEIYWHMEEFSCVLIERNRLWFSSAVKHIQHTWETILKERKEGYEHRAAKKRVPKVNVNVFMDMVSSNYITNIQKKQNVCLIRLDDDGNIH